MCKKIGPSFWRNIATAICCATGKRVRDLPITLDKLQRWKSRWLVHGPDAQVMICGQLESYAREARIALRYRHLGPGSEERVLSIDCDTITAERSSR
jgi:hypothetical protein